MDRVCVTSNFEKEDWEQNFFDFEHFFLLFVWMFQPKYDFESSCDNSSLSYFTKTGKNFKDTNGEFVETVHYTLKKHEEKKGFAVKRKLGTDPHILKAHISISSFDALKMGSIPQKNMMINIKRTTSLSSPRSSPRSDPPSFPRLPKSKFKKYKLLALHDTPVSGE